MKRTQHAQEIAQRFREMVEESGDAIPEKHFDELSLLIEAGIDAALVDVLEDYANQVEQLAQSMRADAERFR